MELNKFIKGEHTVYAYELIELIWTNDEEQHKALLDFAS